MGPMIMVETSRRLWFRCTIGYFRSHSGIRIWWKRCLREKPGMLSSALKGFLVVPPCLLGNGNPVGWGSIRAGVWQWRKSCQNDDYICTQYLGRMWKAVSFKDWSRTNWIQEPRIWTKLWPSHSGEIVWRLYTKAMTSWRSLWAVLRLNEMRICEITRRISKKP